MFVVVEFLKIMGDFLVDELSLPTWLHIVIFAIGMIAGIIAMWIYEITKVEKGRETPHFYTKSINQFKEMRGE